MVCTSRQKYTFTSPNYQLHFSRTVIAPLRISFCNSRLTLSDVLQNLSYFIILKFSECDFNELLQCLLLLSMTDLFSLRLYHVCSPGSSPQQCVWLAFEQLFPSWLFLSPLQGLSFSWPFRCFLCFTCCVRIVVFGVIVAVIVFVIVLKLLFLQLQSTLFSLPFRLFIVIHKL